MTCLMPCFAAMLEGKPKLQTDEKLLLKATQALAFLAKSIDEDRLHSLLFMAEVEAARATRQCEDGFLNEISVLLVQESVPTVNAKVGVSNFILFALVKTLLLHVLCHIEELHEFFKSFMLIKVDNSMKSLHFQSVRMSRFNIQCGLCHMYSILENQI